MVRRSLIALSTVMALTCAAAPAPAFGFAPPAGGETAAASDEVRLVSGGFIRGEIVESMPGEYVVIIPRGSSESRRVAWTDISEVVRGGQSEPSVEPAPNVEPAPSVEPVPAPAPAPSVEPPAEQPGDARAVEGPVIHINQSANKEPMLLFRIDGEAVASSGGYTAHAVAYSEVCESPCDIVLEDYRGEFFVNGQKKYSPSKRFRLSGDHPRYDLDVKPGSRGLRVGGYVTVVSSLVAASLMIAGPFLVDMPVRPHAAGVWAGAGLVGVFGTGGGIAMMFLGRSRVTVRPGSR